MFKNHENNIEKITEMKTNMFVFGRSRDQISVQSLVILTEVFVAFLSRSRQVQG
jgi:hypothetical protein